MSATASNRSRTELDAPLAVACGLALAAGCIHIEAAFEHVDEYLLYAAFFAVLAPAQLFWGIAVYRRPTRGRLLIGILASLGVAALWVASRTAGLPIGPTPWRPEEIGALDVLATLDEICLVFAAFVAMRGGRDTSASRCLRSVAIASGLILILASSLALVASDHAH